eukprot:SAG31_NODE_343_length_17426_cov_35.294443_12_plen_175_part_00
MIGTVKSCTESECGARALHGSLPPAPGLTATAVDNAAADATPGGGAEAVRVEHSTILASCGAGLVGAAVFDVRSLAAPSLWVISCPGWVPLRAQEATVQSWRAFDGNQSLWALLRHAADRSVCFDDFVRLGRAQRLWLVAGDLNVLINTCKYFLKIFVFLKNICIAHKYGETAA